MKVQELSQNLKKVVKPFYMISGDDLYFKKMAISAFKGLVSEDAFDFNITMATTAMSSDAFDVCLQTPPLMSDYRVVFLNSDGKAIPKDKAKEYEEKVKKWVKDPCMNVVLVADNEDDNFKFLSKYAEVVDCKKEKPIYLVGQVCKMISQNGYQINESSVREIVLRCNNDMMIIQNELAKLYAIAEDKNITFDMVQDIVVNNVEQSVFKLTDFIAQGNSGEAFLIVENLLGQGIQPLTILATIASQYRRMFICKVSTQSDEELSKQLGTQQFAVEIAKRTAKSYKPMQLKKIVDKLQLIEYQSKSGEIGMVEGLNLAITYAINRR